MKEVNTLSGIQEIKPGSFDSEKHWYPKSINATIHPLVSYFLNLSVDQIIKRYCHLHPKVTQEALKNVLSYQPKYYYLSGADLIHVTTAEGARQMVVIENNSCPSGQKSMPLVDDFQEKGGYASFIEKTFEPFLKAKRKSVGKLAVLYDKNSMEASGYAAAMADCFDEPVYLVPYYNGQHLENKHVRFEDGLLYLNSTGDNWEPVRGVFRYLTQKPWNRLPIRTKTFVTNPIIVCLAGGRNKMVASKAYDFLNAELEHDNLKILTPETIWDVSKEEIPLWVKKMGGKAVVKIPYSNAGQGVFTIVNEEELDRFMHTEFHYKQFIVQSLIGNYRWSSESKGNTFYHVGTVPNSKGESFALDFRMMIYATPNGYRPLSIYSRRALAPLSDVLIDGQSSWDILGTNLSIKTGENNWESDINRLLLMGRRDFNKLGIGLDDLIDGYIQTVLSTIAIDKMAQNLINSKGKLKEKLFRSLNNDDALIDEILKS